MTVPATSAAKPRRHAWMLWCLFPLGFGAWVPLVAGLRARRPLWIVLGVVFCALALTGLVLSSIVPDDEDGSLAGMLIVVPWIAATVTTFAIYPSYRRRLARRIVATRESIGQFSSVADAGFLLDLDPDTIARLERVAIAIDA